MAEEAFDPLKWTYPFQATQTIHRDPYPALKPVSQKDNIVIITGAYGTIGKATAEVYARASALGIVLVGRDPTKLSELVQHISGNAPESKVLGVAADLVDEYSVPKVFKTVTFEFGRAATVLVNLAGFSPAEERIGTQNPSEWWKGFEVNVKGTALFTHHFIRSQPDSEDPRGTIVNVGSGMAGLVVPKNSGYSISKFALQRFSEYTDAEYPNLRVYTVIPGLVAGVRSKPMFRPYALDHPDMTGLWSIYLSSPRAEFLSGSMISVNWDVEELEANKNEIQREGLFKNGWLRAKLGREGHPWGKGNSVGLEGKYKWVLGSI